MANHFQNPRTNICTSGVITKAKPFRRRALLPQPVSSVSTGLFSITRQSPGCCRDSGDATLAGTTGCGMSTCQRLPASLFAESMRNSSPRGRRFSAAPVLPPHGSSGSSTPFLGTAFSLFHLLSSPARSLPQLLKTPTSSYRSTTPGWQPMTSGPSKSDVFKSSHEKRGQSQAV